LGVTLIAAPAVAQADTFTVNSLADPGTGTCDAAECTLREAVEAANSNSGADVVTFEAGLTGQINLGDGDGYIAFSGDGDIDIQGPGADQITVSGNDADQVF